MTVDRAVRGMPPARPSVPIHKSVRRNPFKDTQEVVQRSPVKEPPGSTSLFDEFLVKANLQKFAAQATVNMILDELTSSDREQVLLGLLNRYNYRVGADG